MSSLCWTTLGRCSSRRTARVSRTLSSESARVCFASHARILSHVVFASQLFDADGIEVRFFNSSKICNNVRNEADIRALVDSNPFKGVTNLGKEMWDKILDPLVVRPAKKGTLEKPVLVITITDGAPYPERPSKIRDVIKDTKSALKSTRYGADAISLRAYMQKEHSS